jgi:pentatricopeptide repeat protein
MKRAQNLHDSHDLATIAAFLIDECDEHWGYGFRGSLLSRLAVAALHMNEVEIARRAIETRHVYERPSMQPYESAAIVRGLMRTGNVEEAWEVLDDELRLPMDGCALDSSDAQQKLKHRAKALSSIATRHFYQGEPYVAAKALFKLGELGFAIDESHMTDGELDMPWTKLVAAAETCHRTLAGNHVMKHPDSAVKLPENLSELVWGAMLAFPCPGGQEECSVDEYLVTTTL